MRSGNRARGVHRRRAAVLLGAGLLAVTPSIADGAAPVAEQQIPFAPVYEGVLAGDLVMAANSNLLSAGGWRRTAAADVDGDASRLCLGRLFVRGDCADNSSSAVLDIPAGARVVHARLYVQASLSSAYGPMRVAPRRPGGRLHLHRDRSGDACGPAALRGIGRVGRSGPTMRQAVWDVTEYVSAAGTGTYTVADIVNERAGAFMPYASWAIVAAYELDPAADLALVAPTPEAQQRFARRAVSWHDGFVARADAPVEVPVNGLVVDATVPVFAKSFHVVGHAPHRGAENLLFNGKPIGNNAPPGAAAPPAGRDPGNRPGVQQHLGRPERQHLPPRLAGGDEDAGRRRVRGRQGRPHAHVGLSRRHGCRAHPRPLLPPRRHIGHAELRRGR